MDVLRHDDVPDQADSELRLEYAQRVDHNLLHKIEVEETESTETGDRPEVDVPGFIVSAEIRGHEHVSLPQTSLTSIRVPHR